MHLGVGRKPRGGGHLFPPVPNVYLYGLVENGNIHGEVNCVDSASLRAHRRAVECGPGAREARLLQTALHAEPARGLSLRGRRDG